MDKRSLAWWLEHLEDVTPAGNGYSAKCPAHADVKASLSITESSNGGVLIHCFAGCSYGDIVKMLDTPTPISISTISPTVSTSASEWWESYTGVPTAEWESWGVVFDDKNIQFTWERSSVTKLRAAGGKVYSWYPQGAATPPLWPDPPSTIASRIFLAEGESDCGVLKHLGLTAFGVTKGAQTPNLDRSFAQFKTLGVREIVFLFDYDEAGQKSQESIVELCLEEGIVPISCELSKILDPFCGEKDLRDVWLRVHDVKEMTRLIDHLIDQTMRKRSRRVSRASLDTFLETPVREGRWLVNQTLLAESVGMIVGAPKMGKSWLALDMGISVASGKPFLGKFEVPVAGPVVIITKEDPDYLLQDRFQKILISKGLGGRVSLPDVFFPKIHLPLYLDLSREFLFTAKDTADLLAWLREIKERHGSLALVIFDPTLRMLEDVDEFKASEVGNSVFATAQIIQTELKSSVILVHHRSKGAGDSKSSYGSMAFHAFSEGTLYLKGDRPNAEGWVSVESEFKSAGGTTWSYRFLDLAERYEVEVSDAEMVKGSQAVDSSLKLLQLLEAAPEGLTVEQLLEGLPEFSDYMIRSTLKALEASNHVHRAKSSAEDGKKGGPRKERWFRT